MAWTQAEIDRQYAESEAIANQALSDGNPELAHAHHKHMQNLVMESQRLNANSGAAAAAGNSGTAAPERDYAAEQRAYEARQLGDTLEAYFQQFGLNGIAAWAKQSAKDGYSSEWIKFNARNQEEYKRRFPAMQYHLDNMTGFTEQDYINYEQLARNLDQQYGMPDNIIYNSVTNLLMNDVDAEELGDRAAMASAAAIQAPEDFKQTMRDFYGIDEGGLTAYFLDPDLATESLKKQSVAAQSGVIAARQGLSNVGRELAEDLYDRGVRDEEE